MRPRGYDFHAGEVLIRVSDDGYGMLPDELPLAVARHATSKIDGSDLLNIRSFGFRGEALASLGAVGRLTLTSRVEGHDGAALTVAGGQFGAVKPAAALRGTVVELRDLFYATPARLKFLRGTVFDPFGYSSERRAERVLIATYEAAIAAMLDKLSTEGLDNALNVANWPNTIRGYGPVKAASLNSARDELETILRK